MQNEQCERKPELPAQVGDTFAAGGNPGRKSPYRNRCQHKARDGVDLGLENQHIQIGAEPAQGRSRQTQ